MKIFNVDDSLYIDIEQFCKLNNIEDVDEFIKKSLISGFNIEKYGDLNDINRNVTPIPIEPQPIVDTTPDQPITSNKYNINVTINKDIKVIDTPPQKIDTPKPIEESKPVEIKKPQDPIKLGDIDIYGETNKGGSWGSNLLDMFR